MPANFIPRPSLARKILRATREAHTHFDGVRALDDESLRSTFHALNLKNAKAFAIALAVTQEVAYRTLKLRPFDEQLTAAAVLFDGVIAEMKTGEGKTLAIALAAAIAARSHESVHIATPNPYLAARDCDAMRPLYEALGLTVGATLPGQTLAQKHAAYGCNIVYGVHSEFAFDYLRDNLVLDSDNRVQKNLQFVIVDEADSILIDEARTPLIISDQADEYIDLVLVADGAVSRLNKENDLTVDEKERTALLTDEGFDHLAELLIPMKVIEREEDLYKPETLPLMRCVEAALRAHFIHKRDKDYVVKDGEALIIDESTGRTLAGRRWQEGVHQAIEAKEKLPVRSETQTVAEITYQSYFGLYQHLSGLTGTALSATEEFRKVYGRKTVAIPTHLPCIRHDLPDVLFASREEKFKAIVDEIYRRHTKGQPILIGTGSVAESEALSKWLTWAGLPHQVLNARQTANEAQVIAEAGLSGAITVATNMAGRGTDIVLGGHLEYTEAWNEKHEAVLASGGLHVIGTQRHESRRIDDQLRGRAGRQGDPGSSQFYLCLEDDLIRIFGARYFENLGRLAGKSEGQGVTSPLLDKVIRKAQKTLEDRNFSARDQLFRFDSVMARQRDSIYGLRRAILNGEGLSEVLHQALETVFAELIDSYSSSEGVELAPVQTAVQALYRLNITLEQSDDPVEAPAAIKHRVLTQLVCAFEEQHLNSPALNPLGPLLLKAIDRAWRDHLTSLDAIREGIHLRSMAQESPVHAFAIEAFKAFENFTREYERDAVLKLASQEEDALETDAKTPKRARLSRCPCGSGLHYKNCHGLLLLNPKARWPVRPAMPFELTRFSYRPASI